MITNILIGWAVLLVVFVWGWKRFHDHMGPPEGEE